MTDATGSVVTGNPEGVWYSGFQNAELRGYVENKGFQNSEAVVESYRNLEKMTGVPPERLVKLPERVDAPEWNDVYSRLGKPAEAKDYELTFDGDATFAERFGKKFHEANLTKAQAKALNDEWNAYVQEMIEGDTAARQQKDAADVASLKSEWGARYDECVELGRRASLEFGLSAEELEMVSGALGSARTLKLFNAIGGKLGEAKSFDGGASGAGKIGFGMSPDAAKSRIRDLMTDKEWTSRYLNGGVVEKDEMTRLHQVAAGQL